MSNKNNCTNNECERQDIYSYKTIPTAQINDSPTPEQISGMNIATLDRGIDSVRTITFQ
jgi:hypothetical protein